MTSNHTTTPGTTKATDDGPFFHFDPTGSTLRGGTQLTIRSITPEDEPRMVRFHETLSEKSIHFRYFGMLSFGFRTGHERLAALCSTDPAREIALVADHTRSDGEHEILGVCRLIKTPGLQEAEFAVLVSDRRQHEGLGTEFLRALAAIGRQAGIRIFGHILPDNVAMLHTSRNLGFELRFHPAEGEWVAELDRRTE